LLLTSCDAIDRVADTGDWAELDALQEQASKACGKARPESTEHYWALAGLRLTGDSIGYYAMHVPFFMLKALAGLSGVADLSRGYAERLRDIVAKPIRNGRGKRMKNPTRAHTFPVLRDSHVTSTVRDLAAMMYETRDFSAMPILADALEDAGCDDAGILDHCRDTSLAHVRGCWVVDLVLGKA